MYLKPKWILQNYRMQHVLTMTEPKWILQNYRMQHVLTMTEHTLTLWYFHVSLFLRDFLSLSFMSLNNTDVNFNCFKSFYENVSLDSLFIIIRKTSWSIEVLLTNYRSTWCCFYYYKIDMLHLTAELLGICTHGSSLFVMCVGRSSISHNRRVKIVIIKTPTSWKITT